MALTASEATAQVAKATGRELTLVGALAGGETGATEICDREGGRFVLKWEDDPSNRARRREAVILAERLRTEAAWPVPRQEAIEADGWLFVVQELRPGHPVTHVSPGLAGELLDLHQARLGLARPTDPDRWAEDLLTTLTVGGQGYCLHESLRAHDARTRRLVHRIESIGRSLTREDLPGGDIVHWDLHPGNTLTVDGELSAVIDLDFAKVGDADFDLVTLAVASLATGADAGVRSRLFAAAFDELDDARRGAYVGHLLIRFIDWPIRRARPQEVELWLAHADRLLEGC